MEERAHGGMRRLGKHDLLHVKAAECWLALGNLEEANREVESIRPRNRRHPEVHSVCERIRAGTRYVSAVIADNRILEPFWDVDFDYVIGRAATR